MTAHDAVGAFFDLDGTLLRPPSLESRFFAWLVARRQLRSNSAAFWLAHFAKNILRNPRIAIRANKNYLSGVPVSLVADWAVSLKPESLEVYPQALTRISWHLCQHHRVCIISGTLAPLARIFARRISLGIEVAATELQISHGRWTGSLAGEHLNGAAKRNAIDALVAKHSLRLDLSYAYGDTMADFAMLDCVANPHAVNPGIALRRIAQKMQWTICDWESAVPATKKPALTIAREPS